MTLTRWKESLETLAQHVTVNLVAPRGAPQANRGASFRVPSVSHSDLEAEAGRGFEPPFQRVSTPTRFDD